MNLRIVLFFATLITIAITHYVSLVFFLYWKYLWLDIPMHILGGACIALGYSILPFFHIKIPPFFTTPIWYIVAVLFVGVTWEIFEYYAGISTTVEDLVPDTVGDLFMDALGGVIGYGIVRKISTL